MSSTDYKAADDGAVTSASAPPMMVHVVAPASLPEGYTFEANINNDPERTFTVEVVSIFGSSTSYVISCVGNILFAHPDPFGSRSNVLYCGIVLFEHLLIPSCSSSTCICCEFNNSPLEA